jgi:hypothetical protein
VLQQQAVHFAVNVLYGYLEAIEGPSLRYLHLCPMLQRQKGPNEIRWSFVESKQIQVSSLLNDILTIVAPDMKRTARFSITMPSDAAKKARICVMKCLSSSVKSRQPH